MCKCSKQAMELARSVYNSNTPLDTAMFVFVGVPFLGVSVGGVVFSFLVTQYVNWSDARSIAQMKKASK